MTLGFLFAPFAPSHWKPELKSAILFSQGQKIKASSLLLLDESSSIRKISRCHALELALLGLLN
jgi:hypothetical protein